PLLELFEVHGVVDVDDEDLGARADGLEDGHRVALKDDDIRPLLERPELAVVTRAHVLDAEGSVHLLRTGAGDETDVVVAGEEVGHVPGADGGACELLADRVARDNDDLGALSGLEHIEGTDDVGVSVEVLLLLVDGSIHLAEETPENAVADGARGLDLVAA